MHAISKYYTLTGGGFYGTEASTYCVTFLRFLFLALCVASFTREMCGGRSWEAQPSSSSAPIMNRSVGGKWCWRPRSFRSRVCRYIYYGNLEKGLTTTVQYNTVILKNVQMHV